MEIILLSSEKRDYTLQAAELLAKTFPCYADCSNEEISKCLEDGKVAVAAIEEGKLLGFVGAAPQYGVTAWELHPLVVDEDARLKGIGRYLCLELEGILRQRGCLTIFLGCDDENDSTTLSNTNLFENTFEKIEGIVNLRRHPFEFYQKAGYKIVGVLPDANGMGKPDIWMAKSIV